MSEPGLRARKMARTRNQIAEAALAAFMARGYDATTLEEIAEAAEVHKRTLLRYFPTKTHLVLHRQHAAYAQFQAALAGRGDTPVIDVWQSHVVEHARALTLRGPAANIGRLAMKEPAVRQAVLDIRQQYQRAVARALDEETALNEEAGGSGDGRIWSRVVAAALIGGNYAVADMILRDDDYTDLERAELQVIRLVREGLLAGR